jgi:hypothetical protein
MWRKGWDSTDGPSQGCRVFEPMPYTTCPAVGLGSERFSKAFRNSRKQSDQNEGGLEKHLSKRNAVAQKPIGCRYASAAAKKEADHANYCRLFGLHRQ